MSIGSDVDHEAGSSIVELVVAAALTVIAVVILSGHTLPALRSLSEAAEPHQRQLELVAASELVARAVRSARPEHQRPATGGDDRTLLLAMGPGATVRFSLDGGDLDVDVEGSPAGMEGLTGGTLVRGLDMGRSGFAFLSSDGGPLGAASPAAVVAIVLEDEGSSVVRIVRPRLVTRLDGATPW